MGAVADIVVRPTSIPAGGIAANAFWVNGTEAQPWTAKIDLAADGTIHLRGTIDAPWGGVDDDLDLL